MPKTISPQEQLASFIAKFTPEIASLTKNILSGMRSRFPTAQELVYDNYNALAIGFSPTERATDGVFSIAVYPKWVSLFFLQAQDLSDPNGLLKGSGKVAKHVILPSAAALNSKDLQSLMKQAIKTAKLSFDSKGQYRLIIKSVSAKQRPRRPPPPKPKP